MTKMFTICYDLVFVFLCVVSLSRPVHAHLDMVISDGINSLDTNSTICVPGDRVYCHHRGVCSIDGMKCDCDDPLHYWSSEQCSTENIGPELEDGQCCKPGSVDAYCYWTGVCHANGLWCTCSSSHFWASERCAIYHMTPDPDPEPSECPPLHPPTSSPTEYVSIAPTSSVPSLEPTFILTECIPGTRGYCNHRGTCSEAGDVCECDDPLHYWPSERCGIEHPGPELEEGQCCKPGDVDAYCSWIGRCHTNGLWCNCSSPHFWASERCAYWHHEVDPNPKPSYCPPPPNFDPTMVPTAEPTFTWKPSTSPTSEPTYFSSPCNPGSRGYCNNRGFCSITGMCECDDPLHYWPSEMCSTYHPGPELADGECCTPGRVDYYCSWIGTCHENGLWCVCPTSNFWAYEGCSTWHDTPDPDPEPPLCPGATYPPSGEPSVQPSGVPTNIPTSVPTAPTSSPSSQPSVVPSSLPTADPSSVPSIMPSSEPTTEPSTIPTSVPTHVPSFFPTSNPTICVAGDRAACSNNGFCASNSGGCECDDSLHYWPSEQCLTFHEGPELLPGQYCSPNERNIYCSYLGVCSSDGLSCICDDPDHRTTVDRCADWNPPPPPSSGLCLSGDRAPCHNRGTCDSTSGENICTCDDPLHYWPSEFCEFEHFGGELAPGDCCIPGLKDYYCSWMGYCDDSGDFCICDSVHRWSSQRCEVWHDTEDPNPPSDGDSCPLLIFDEEGTTTKSAGSAELLGLSSSVFFSLIFCVVGLMILVASVLRRRYTVKEEMRDSQFTYDEALSKSSAVFNVKSPYFATKAANTLEKVGLEKAGEYIRNKSFGYGDVDDDETGVEMTEDEFSKPSNFTYDDVSSKASMFEEKSPYEVAKEEEIRELNKPSNFSYDDAVRQDSLHFSNENSLHMEALVEKENLLADDENGFGLNNNEANI